VPNCRIWTKVGSSVRWRRLAALTLERRVKLRHEDEALEVSMGIVLGLYRAEHSGFELLEYAEDSPSELAGHAVEIWPRRRRDWAVPRSWVEKYTPKWAWLVR
jgi:hypothetical protein